MRGMGNKCTRKFCESLAMAAVMMVILYYSGGIEIIIAKWNPELVKRTRVENTMLEYHASEGLINESSGEL